MNPLDILTADDCERISRQTLQQELSDDTRLLSVKVIEFKYEHHGSECNGFLGDYYRLKINVAIDHDGQNNSGGVVSV